LWLFKTVTSFQYAANQLQSALETLRTLDVINEEAEVHISHYLSRIVRHLSLSNSFRISFALLGSFQELHELLHQALFLLELLRLGSVVLRLSKMR
jgi:hypothetical protein